ncbi:hypothetical protein F3Y22_tig00001644pilonHSYRG00157 [Hibiscus syriacus]|uniref:Reverse transcriptase Ty1/copia-type domain-containing protein n=1 Tax=Hibiscus syriacus TaxID=106335 RepID=A0A6A3CV61_HIBSY|nr:hypothetical protein F3Y22_tig00001644pilonHSYRG00157 [Hibiscus syriacus]
MTTRSKNNIHKPLTKINVSVIISQPSNIEPHTVSQALKYPKWRQAMNDEFDALARKKHGSLFRLLLCKILLVKLLYSLCTQRFSIKGLGTLSYFLGIEVLPTLSGLLLTQRRYITDLLTRTKKIGAKPVSTPLVTDGNLTLHSDVDWDGNKDDYTSMSAYIVYLGRHPISLSSKKQHTIARSSTEAEYLSVASTTSKLNWICSLLIELGITLFTSTVIYCDNVGATYLYSNPVFHLRMKHVALDYHFIRGQVQSGALRVTHVSSADQLADALTKPFP